MSKCHKADHATIVELRDAYTEALTVVARVVTLRDHWKTAPNPAIPTSSLGLMLAVVGDLTDALDGVS